MLCSSMWSLTWDPTGFKWGQQLLRQGEQTPTLSKNPIITHVDMQRPEILSKLFLLLKTNVLEILIAEDDDAALGDEQR